MKIEIITPLYTFLSVCFYSVNVKTAEPIGAKFCVGHHVTTGKVYGWSEKGIESLPQTLIPISLKLDGVNLWYFKLNLYDPA